MTLPRYGKYRDSGANWLGDIPAHWEVCALKRLASLKSGETINSDSIEEVGDYPVFGGNGLRGFTSSYTHQGTFALIGRQGALCGNVNYAHGKFWASEHAVVVSPLKPVETIWLGELLRAMNLNQYSVSAAQPGLSVEIISALPLPFPPLPEQTAIAAFLDRETGKIDALVAEQEKLIALLKEKRQAVISHAVTKGLDPAAPMKDSGIEWLSEVPAHWDVVPLKYLVRFQSGGTPNKETEAYWGGEVPWASAKDMKSEYLYDTEDHITDRAVEDGAATLLNEGAVVVVVRGMILARLFPVAVTRARMAINQDLKGIVPGDRLLAEHFAWYLRGTADETLRRLDEAGHGTKALRMDAWTSLQVALPPLSEQSFIAANLDRETIKLDTLISEAGRAVALLKERRTALISAAVTGKIDVRGLVDMQEAA
jgi:type I restriction enzyme, S subunit